MARPYLRSVQRKYCARFVYCGLVLTVGLPLTRIQASQDTSYIVKEVRSYNCVVGPGQGNSQLSLLEPGKPIERELTGDQSQAYRLPFTAGQYVKLVVEQRGIDIVVRLFGPDGKLVTEVNSESRAQGQETATWVAEETGSYRVEIAARSKNAAAGRYRIQVAELRIATEDDRALQEARKLNTEFGRLFRAGKFDEARPLGERVLEIRERVLGPDHPDVAASLSNLALLHTERGDYARAESLYERALAIGEKALGPEHPDVAAALTNVAKLYYEKGEYTRAEPLFERALAIGEKALGPEHPYVIAALQNLAAFYRTVGDYDKAESLFGRTLTLGQKVLGPEHPYVAGALINFANFYSDRGDYARAEPLYGSALTIKEKALGPDHPDVARALDNLARLYRERGEYARAEPLFGRALAIREKALGPEHPDVAVSLSNLAELYLEKDEDARAEPLLERALAIMERALGPEYPKIAEVLDNLAHLYRERRDYARAEALYRRAVTISEKALGPEHRVFADTLYGLAELFAARGDYTPAVEALSRANAVDERNFARQLAIGSERQKLVYLDLFSKRIDLTLSLQSRAAPADPQALNLAFTTLLRRKARALDAMTDTIATLRRYATPEDQELFNRLTRARSQLATLTLNDPGASKLDTYRTRIEKLEVEVDELEGRLNSRSAKFRQQTHPVTLSAVQAALSPGGALVEFIYFTPRELQTGKAQPPRYLAYLLLAQCQPKWVDLGEAAVIDHAIDAWRKALRNPKRTDVNRLARAVDEKVMRPVRSLLSAMSRDTRHLLIAPDGSLNLIPFAAMVDERNRYLIERYTISYLTCGRDLLRLQTSVPSQDAPLVIANPDFGKPATMVRQEDRNSGKPRARNQSRSRFDPAQTFFQPLPGTGDEARAIKALLANASVLEREDATETALKQARGPQILHIATHGFFLDYRESPPAGNDLRRISRATSRSATKLLSDLRLSIFAAQVKDPLLRSGIALAGANQGQSGDEDGVLTALEAASLDLSGTKLVVLSACDTGVGEIRNGEGVQGLRRALVLAGSESQVMSLWPVSDDSTKDLMVPYYQALQQGAGRSEGLRQVQLQMLRGRREQRHPFYWAAFIQSGEWANLDGQR